MSLALKKNVIFVTYGEDMLRVPGSSGSSLKKIMVQGADIRVVASTLEAIDIAIHNPVNDVIFMGIGYETISPTVASMVKTCKKKAIKNLSVFSVHKVIPPAIKVLMDDPELAIDGFICPGHVSVIIGFDGYTEIPERGRAAVITGFDPVDIIEGIHMLLAQIIQGRFLVENQYSREVEPQGNTKAIEVLKEVFMSVPAEWRGLGIIQGSGLVFNDTFSAFNALARFDVPIMKSSNIMGCMCGSILRGVATPHECLLFRHACNPGNPIGPCMVSREGTCSTYYKYH
jgi:hydrogenase expression/formation protein HypD